VKDRILNSLRNYFQSNMNKHQVNVEVMLNNPLVIPEHMDMMEALEKEISIIAEYHDKLEVLDKYF
jgi:hypothetical protein